MNKSKLYFCVNCSNIGISICFCVVFGGGEVYGLGGYMLLVATFKHE
jgi:hypothetical protein